MLRLFFFFNKFGVLRLNRDQVITLETWLDFTKTIIPLALMASESIAHEAEGH